MATSYSQFVQQAGKDTVHRHYHDNEYGLPLKTDNELFARLILEINQAGLFFHDESPHCNFKK